METLFKKYFKFLSFNKYKIKIMKIVNGRWVDDNEQPVDHFNITDFLEIGDNVKKMYGDDITYSRISLVSAIKALTPEQEDSLAYILSNNALMSKLAGF